MFKPGTFAVSKKGSQKLWRVLQATAGRPYLSKEVVEETPTKVGITKCSSFTLDCYYIDFDGREFGPLQRRFEIQPFEGWREVLSLELHPVCYGEKGAEMLSGLNTRGEKFVRASESQHMYCKGRTLIRSPAGEKLSHITHSEDVESSVVIDFDRTLQFNPDWRPELGWRDRCEQDNREVREMTIRENREVCRDVFCCENENIVDDYNWDRLRAEDFYQERESLGKDEYGDSNKLIQEERALLPSRLFGFILRSRKWASLHVDTLTPVKEEKDGFKKLRLPRGHDRMLLGLVETHFRRRENVIYEREEEDDGFDVTRSKPRGLIILLHGAPGVGKTSTAECIAASNAKPLFPITCVDLGMSPEQVEGNLEMNFQLAQSWSCVLLLDEADVFLAERKKEDIQRNALVSVFLRALEYYTGILFLTTNRVGTIDEAFRSRIHMILYYPPLDWPQTKAIWEDNLEKATKRKDMALNKDELLRYAEDLYQQQVHRHKVGWNGRQIRNAFQTAVALAEHDSHEMTTDPEHPARPSLRLGYFQEVAKASVDFDEYLKKTLEMKAPDYAQSQHWRFDNYKESNAPSSVPWSAPNQSGAAYQQNPVPPQMPQSLGPQWTPMMNQSQPGPQGPSQPWQQPQAAFGQTQNSVPAFSGQALNYQGQPMMQGYSQGFNPANGVGGMPQGYGQQGPGGQMPGQTPPPGNMSSPPPQSQGTNMPNIGNQNIQSGGQPGQPQAQGMNGMPPGGPQGQQGQPRPTNQWYG